MYEAACEENFSGPGICDTDQLSFKAYLARWMASVTKLAPWTTDQIMPLLKSSAQAAAQQCTGGSDGVTCGSRWWMGWDGSYGVGQQMSALEVIQANLISFVSGPVGNSTGGTSRGNPSAGMGEGNVKPPDPITTGDKAGAGVLTAAVLAMLLGGSYVSSLRGLQRLHMLTRQTVAACGLSVPAKNLFLGHFERSEDTTNNMRDVLPRKRSQRLCLDFESTNVPCVHKRLRALRA